MENTSVNLETNDLELKWIKVKCIEKFRIYSIKFIFNLKNFRYHFPIHKMKCAYISQFCISKQKYRRVTRDYSIFSLNSYNSHWLPYSFEEIF